MSMGDHVATTVRDFLTDDLHVECSCGWVGEKAATKHGALARLGRSRPRRRRTRRGDTGMIGTTAVMTDQLGYAQDAGEAPLCPACRGGRLHPYAVMFSFPTVINGLHYTSGRVDWLEGWVAVCVGNEAAEKAMTKRYEAMGEEYDPEGEIATLPPCGFSMPLTPRRRGDTP